MACFKGFRLPSAAMSDEKRSKIWPMSSGRISVLMRTRLNRAFSHRFDKFQGFFIEPESVRQMRLLPDKIFNDCMHVVHSSRLKCKILVIGI
jgi:hypothetical protein